MATKYTQTQVESAMLSTFGDRGRGELSKAPWMLELITGAMNEDDNACDLEIDGDWNPSDVELLKQTLAQYDNA